MNEGNGYVKLYRKILNNPIVWKDSDHLAIWCYLLLNATHRGINTLFKGERIILEPGQLITGILSIAEKLKIDKMKVQRTLKEFESDKQIEQQTSNKNRLITILNWEEYQNNDKQNDKQLINNRETTDKQVITNNNEKNVKNNILTSTIYDLIEQNFGRTLSPLEYEEVSYWEDTELTRYAIRESVLNGKFGIKYISTILNSYKKENITTVQEAKMREEQFKKQKNTKETKKYMTSHDRWEETKRKFLEEEEND